MYLSEMSCEDGRQVEVTHNLIQWQALVVAMLKF